MNRRSLLLAGLALALVSCKTQEMNTNELRPIPDASYAKGVSAPFCGVAQGVLVVAGGANFPDKPLLEGGAKRMYNDIWIKSPSFWKKWIRAGHLPDSTAYGATFQLGDTLVFAGGNAEGETTDKVYSMHLSFGKAVLRTLPQLPVPLEQAGFTRDGDHLYLVGGLSGAACSTGVYVCNTEDYRWEKLTDLPEPLVQPLAFAAEGTLYVWGGFNPETLEVSPRGLSLNLEHPEAWAEAPSVPDDGTFTGAAGCTMPDCRLVVVGGVNREIFARALHNTPEDRIPYLSKKPSEYQFRSDVWRFDPATEEWKLLGNVSSCALAGPGVAVCGLKEIYVAGGELKPGVRSPKIFTLRLP
jgi:sialate O-acetylesterase